MTVEMKFRMRQGLHENIDAARNNHVCDSVQRAKVASNVVQDPVSTHRNYCSIQSKGLNTSSQCGKHLGIQRDTEAWKHHVRCRSANQLNSKRNGGQSSFNGRDITVDIVKVGGDKEEIQTKIYEVVVSGMNDSKKYVINLKPLEYPVHQ